MRNVRIFVEDLDRRELDCLYEAIYTVNGLQTEFLVSLDMKQVRLPGETFFRAEDSFYRLHRLARSDCAMCITTRRFWHNDFQQADESASIITIEDWESAYAPPGLKVYLVYQFAFAFVCWASNHTSFNALTHRGTIGCRMDSCTNKRDIKWGMLTGYICGKCCDEMRRLGASTRQVCAIKSILHYVHMAALGQEEYIDWNSAFVVMRFSEGDENQNAYEKGIRPGLEAVRIRVTRGDDIVQSRPLLEKVTDQIKSARFIVAKVDEERMNVYYELGFAMGTGKDVLLVSEKQLRLPSDLSNWECLTYPRGDYSTLYEGVIHFFEDNYHMRRST